jgi:hypothetical protein
MQKFRDVSLGAPAGTLDGEPLAWETGPARYGADAPAFL